MIEVICTPNCAGVKIRGDFNDFNRLYDALHIITGQEDEYKNYESSVIERVLALCYDLRHSIMGDREFESVPNGMEMSKFKRRDFIALEYNTYFSFNVLWPEVLFDMIAINDLVYLYSQKKASEKYFLINDSKLIWDGNIAIIRFFQSAAAECIKNTVSKQSFARMMNLIITPRSTILEGFIWQYLDLLNMEFAALNKEMRLKKLPLIAKRLVQPDDEYVSIKKMLFSHAKMNNCRPEELKLASVEIPDEINW